MVYNIKALFLALMLSFTLTANALDSKEAVGTKSGHHVKDANGHCVRTKWGASNDECGRFVKVASLEDRTVHFDFDSSELSVLEKLEINALADTFMKHKVTKVKIIGFADRLGASEYNQRLSERRAMAVKKYLDTKVKLESSPISIKGIGSSSQIKVCEGVTGNELKTCLAPNRRVEIEINYVDSVSEPE